MNNTFKFSKKVIGAACHDRDTLHVKVNRSLCNSK